MAGNSAILLVDDDEDSILLLQHALDIAKVANGRVVAHDGQEAVDYLTASGIYAGKNCPWPALMILDLKMPGMDGFEVLEWFRQFKKRKDLPIAVMTASNNESDRERAMSLGASAYYIKPGSFTDLVDIARELRKRWL